MSTGNVGPQPADVRDSSKYDFFRCASCFRLITRPEHDHYMQQGVVGACRHFRVRPVNPAWWEFLVFPRVWWFAFLRATGQA